MSGALSGGSPGALPTGALIAHMSGADVFGLVVTVLIIGYLFYALIRGEKL
jgi:K+-transporting ATPase KdpF subunit